MTGDEFRAWLTRDGRSVSAAVRDTAAQLGMGERTVWRWLHVGTTPLVDLALEANRVRRK